MPTQEDPISKCTVVTAIVPTFNRAEYVVSSIQSLLAQTVSLSRIIVVDDGSTDETPRVLAAFGDAIEYHRQPNRGKSAALNMALQIIDEGWVWIFDDDDIAQPDALEKLLRGFYKDPLADFVFGLNDNFGLDQEGKEYRYTLPVAAAEPEYIFPRLLEGMFVNQGAMLVRRRCYEDVGPFNERLVRSQDYDMALRLARSRRGRFIDELIYSQRQHDGVRGTRASPLSAADREKAWLEYDQKILNSILPSLKDEEFIERAQAAPAESSIAFRAHLRRFVVFARAALPQQASSELQRGAALAGELGMQSLNKLDAEALSRAFDVTSRSSVSTFLSAEIQLGLEAFSCHALRLEIKRALGIGLSKRVLVTMKKRSLEELSEVLYAIAVVRGIFYATQTLAGTILGVMASRLRRSVAAKLGSSSRLRRMQVVLVR